MSVHFLKIVFFTSVSLQLCFAGICGNTKVIHLRKPDSWFGVWAYVHPLYKQQQLIRENNGWFKFDLISNYPGDTTHFALLDGPLDDSEGINRKSFNVPNVNFSTDNKFQCSDFEGSLELYISENLNEPGTTYLGTTKPTIKVVKFLPPLQSDWVIDIPYFSSGSNPRMPMKSEVDDCGWFSVTFFNTPPPATISLYPNSSIATGLSNISLTDLFSETIDTVYLDGSSGSVISTINHPSKKGFCSFHLDALLYDTDPSLHDAFTCDDYPNMQTTSCAGPNTFLVDSLVPCAGVTRGIVASNLGQDSKPIYQIASGCFSGTKSFDQLFRTTPGVNKTISYKLQLSRAANGLWVYNSENEPSQGFFPIQGEPDEGTGKQYLGYGRIKYGVIDVGDSMFDWNAINPLNGFPFIDTRETKAGEFSTGQNPDVYNNSAWGDCPNVYGPCRIKGMYDQHFCMEIHADFKYLPGQELLVKGDDDIWAFINKKLVIDLGGYHLAAPHYLKLDTLGLVSGKTYPFDYFHCDRRTNMSNLKFQTNMFFQGTELTAPISAPSKINDKARSTSTAIAIQGHLTIPHGLVGKAIQIFTLQGKWISSVRSESRDLKLPASFSGMVFLIAR